MKTKFQRENNELIDKDLQKALYAEFGKNLGEEMVLKILAGYTPDAAIQIVLENKQEYRKTRKGVI